MKTELLKEIEKTENLIKIYSERDEIRTKLLEHKLKKLNGEYLDYMIKIEGDN